MKFKGYCVVMTASLIILILVLKSPIGDILQKQLPSRFLYSTVINKQTLKEEHHQSLWKSMTRRGSQHSTLATEYRAQTVHREVFNYTDISNVTISAPENKQRQESLKLSVTPKLEQKQTGWTMVNRKSQTQIFSAYLEDRNKQLKLIILGLQDHTKTRSLHYYCVLKYPNETEVCLTEPAIQSAFNQDDEKKRKHVWAYSFTCIMDKKMDIPLFVKLTKNTECSSKQETNWLPISTRHLDQSHLIPFGVCIETPLFRSSDWEIPVELVIEGIERNRALGAEWITVYVQDTSEDIIKVLKDYEKEGVLEIVYWNLPKEAIEHSHYYAESISIADCLYRNMYRVKYLAFVDLDEIIVPQNHSNWTDMITAIDKTNIASFQFDHTATHPNTQLQLQGEFNWTCHVQNIERRITQHALPIYMRNSYRTPPYISLKRLADAPRRKTIVKPSLVKRLGIHKANSFLNSTHQIIVPPEIGLLYHFRTPPLCDNCIKFLKEDHRLQDLLPSLFDTIRERLCRYL